MDDMRELVDALNRIGTDPQSFLNEMREGVIHELRRGIDDIDRGLDGIKREILGDVHRADDAAAERALSPEPVDSTTDDCMYWFLQGKEYDFENGLDWAQLESGNRANSTCAIWRGADGLEDWDRYFSDVLAQAEPYDRRVLL